MLAPLWLAGLGVVAPDGSEPLDLLPDPLDFGFVVIGDASQQTLRVRNDTGASLTVTGVRLEPADAFTIVTDACTGSELPVDGGCDVGIAFSPTEEGSASADVVVDTSSGTTRGGVAGTAVLGDTEPSDSFPADTAPLDTFVPTSTAPSPTVAPSSSQVPATTASRGPDDLTDVERLAACERRAANAEVRFEERREMIVNEAERFAVSAALVQETPGPTTSTGDGEVIVAPVRLRCEVQAQLRGVDFRVEPPGFQQGSFLDQDVIDWSWDVVPLVIGTTALTLEIRSVAVVDGRRIEGSGNQLFTAEIDVEAKDEDAGATFKRWSENVVDHPLVRGFGSLLVLGGAAAAVWRWLLKRPWPWNSA